MKRILSISINYRSAPVELREKLSFSGERLAPAMRRLAQILPGCEVVLLSTCNRTELYLTTQDDCACQAETICLDFLAQAAHLPQETLLQAAAVRSGEAAVRHLLRVAAGLDSLVIGENEILGQVKQAYAAALACDTCGPLLSALFRSAIQAGKRARAQAEVGRARQSVAAVVVALARQSLPPTDCSGQPDLPTAPGDLSGVASEYSTPPGNLSTAAKVHSAAFGGANTSDSAAAADNAAAGEPSHQAGDLSGHTALIVGAGKISAMTARLLVQAGLRCILIANRTYAHAVKLAEGLGGQAVHFDQLDDFLEPADIVICSTGAPHTVLHLPAVQKAMLRRAQRPLLIADLAVPRDVDEQVAELPNVRLVNIDDLESLAADMLPLSAAAVQHAEQVVCEETRAFQHWLGERRSANRIAALQAKADAICQAQLEKTLRRCPDLRADQQDALQALAHAIAGHLLADQIREIKAEAQE